jgi:hypothetical protein
MALFTAPTADSVTIADADSGSESICYALDPEDMRVCHNADCRCPLSTLCQAVPLHSQAELPHLCSTQTQFPLLRVTVFVCRRRASQP